MFIPGLVEEEAAIAPIVNDQFAPLLDNWDSDSDDESSFYYPPPQEVEVQMMSLHCLKVILTL